MCLFSTIYSSSQRPHNWTGAGHVLRDMFSTIYSSSQRPHNWTGAGHVFRRIMIQYVTHFPSSVTYNCLETSLWMVLHLHIAHPPYECVTIGSQKSPNVDNMINVQPLLHWSPHAVNTEVAELRLGHSAIAILAQCRGCSSSSCGDTELDSNIKCGNKSHDRRPGSGLINRMGTSKH